jgi:hypothetical protein
MKHWNKMKVVALLGSVLLLLGLGVSFAGRASSGHIALPAFTPAAAARQDILSAAGGTCAPRRQFVPGSFQVIATRAWQNVVLVFSQLRCGAQPGDPGVMEQRTSRVQLTWSGWQVTAMGGSGSNPQQPAASGIAGVSVDWRNATTAYASTLVHGHVLDADVHTVEVTFSDGTRQQTAASEEVFVIGVPDIVGVCDVRALDDQGQLLAEEHVSGIPPGSNQQCP